MNSKTPDQRNSKVLLCIDDDEEDLDIFDEAVHEADSEFRCIKAHSGIDGLNLLEKVLPDYVFLDINMPVMNGIAVLDRIRSQTHLRELPVIIWSTSIQDRLDLIRRGANECWKKPNTYHELVWILKKFFGSADNAEVTNGS